MITGLVSGDRSGQYWDDRGAAAEGYYGGMRDDTVGVSDWPSGGREQAQILAMADMQRAQCR